MYILIYNFIYILKVLVDILMGRGYYRRIDLIVVDKFLTRVCEAYNRKGRLGYEREVEELYSWLFLDREHFPEEIDIVFWTLEEELNMGMKNIQHRFFSIDRDKKQELRGRILKKLCEYRESSRPFQEAV